MADGHRVAVYYQTQYDRTLSSNSDYGHYVSPLPLITFITHLILAAFHINMNLPTTIALNDYSPDNPYFDQMWEDIGIMKQAGIKVIGMLGGAAPGTYECLTPANFDTYYPQLTAYIAKYELDGMDLDVEQAESLADIINFIQHLKADFGDDFIITLAPVASALTESGNLSGFDYIQLEESIGNHISWYNAQFYSGFGYIYPDDQYIDIVNYGTGLDPSRLVATSLTSSANGGGYIAIEEVVTAVNMLTALYGDKFGGVAGWEYFNSVPDYAGGEPWQWAETMQGAMNGSVISNSTRLDGVLKKDTRREVSRIRGHAALREEGSDVSDDES